VVWCGACVLCKFHRHRSRFFHANQRNATPVPFASPATKPAGYGRTPGVYLPSPLHPVDASTDGGGALRHASVAHQSNSCIVTVGRRGSKRLMTLRPILWLSPAFRALRLTALSFRRRGPCSWNCSHLSVSLLFPFSPLLHEQHDQGDYQGQHWQDVQVKGT
jgi:hypothetical protein